MNYSDFLAATMNLNNFVDENKLKTIFNAFDTERTGRLTRKNIFYALQKLGLTVPLEEVEKAFEKHNTSKSNAINYEEFKAMFTLKGEENEY